MTIPSEEAWTEHALAPVAPAPVRLVTARPPDATLVESYRRLADVFHDVLAEQRPEALLERIADTLAELVPYDTLTIYEADEATRVLNPVLARDHYAEEILNAPTEFGIGITGWAVQHGEPVLANRAHLDPRVSVIPGTPEDEPEALVSIPLVARGQIKGALNIYRLGETASFSTEDFELAKHFADAAALALDNAHIRARLEHQAQTDPLTGLYNHRAFHERLRGELQRASRSGDSVGVLMLDIDDFKRVNDVHGHGMGDEVLRELADALRTTVRAADVVCRVGGEEFAVILSPGADGSALGLAERLMELLKGLDLGPAGPVTVSCGFAQGPEHAMNSRELFACAEAAMMAAKAEGKNRIVLFEEDAAHARPDGERRSEVRSAAHLRVLQALSGKLNRLVSPSEIGDAIVNELRSLIDYHNCRVFVVEGDDLVPIAFRGEFSSTRPTTMDVLTCKVGDGITGRVAETGRAMLLGDAARCEFAVPVPGTEDIQESLIAVPLSYGSRVVGVIVVSKLGRDQFDEHDVRLLEVLAGHAAVALENARLYEAQRREAESATALLEFSRELASAGSLDETLECVVARAAGILGSPQTSVWLQDAATGELGVSAEFGHSADARSRLLAIRLPADLAHRFLEHPDPFCVTGECLSELTGLPQPGGFAIAPLLLDGGRNGCIAVVVPDGGAFGDRALRLLGGLAHQAKLAITNAGNFQNLEQTFLTTVEALANALEANDEHTSSHARSITDTALRVGLELGLDGEALKRLELGALFHDIGRIGIPSEILSKPGRLTEAERRVVETHPELGERILAPIERLQHVSPVVRACRERYDGRGYPDARAGEEIPIESRIIFVCDAFHAMTTDRPYRKRLPSADALRRLHEGAGSQFDPHVVGVFARLVAASSAPDE